jgi:tetratricopeptide (TPR) repeat protein
LATSRKNEYRPRLRFKTEPITLEPPNNNEKELILQRLDKSRLSLTPEQQKRLDNANQFLVLMMELKTGKELHEIVRDVLERLRKSEESIYRAFHYLCFSYRYSVSIPESLLERLDPSGNFYKLPEKDAAQGLIFRNEGRTDSLRAGHPLIADVAFGLYGRSPVNVLCDIAGATNPSNDLERRYLVNLLRAEAIKEPLIVKDVLPQIQETIKECERVCTINDLYNWRSFYLVLKEHNLSERCVDNALSRKPRSSLDCNFLLWFFRLRNREKEALPIIAEWINNNPDEHDSRVTFLRLLEIQGADEEIKKSISETGKWLATHLEDKHVRHHYLGLVERRGAPKQVTRVLGETSKWLETHSEDYHVRTFYLGLVERRGTSEQVTQILEETNKWLETHSENKDVRIFYLGLVERRGTPTQVRQVLEETNKWLEAHSEDYHVRTFYLGLVERTGTAEQVTQVLEETNKWLETHSKNKDVRVFDLGLVERRGTPTQVRQALKETSKRLESHSEDYYVRTFYLGLVERRGTSEQVTQVLEETSKWLETHSENKDVRTFYLGLVERRGTSHQVEKVVKEIMKWLQKHVNATDVWDTTISLLIRFNRIEEAGMLVTQAISFHPDNNNLNSQYLRLFQNSDDEQAIRKFFEKLIERFPRDRTIPYRFATWLRDHDKLEEARQRYQQLIKKSPNDWRALHGYGRLLLKEEKYVEATKEFQDVLKRHPGHQMANDGLAYAMSKIGEMAEAKGAQEHASRFYGLAEKKFREAIKWAKKNKEPQGVFHANLGWFYLARNRFNDARIAFSSAISENDRYFSSFWGIGRAYIGLEDFQSAANALQMALDKAKETKIVLQPPASEEIPELLRQCEEIAEKVKPTKHLAN